MRFNNRQEVVRAMNQLAVNRINNVSGGSVKRFEVADHVADAAFLNDNLRSAKSGASGWTIVFQLNNQQALVSLKRFVDSNRRNDNFAVFD